MSTEQLRSFFDKDWYLKENPDVKNAGIDPWIHYEKFGLQEGRLPCYLESKDLDDSLWRLDGDEYILHKLDQLAFNQEYPLEAVMASWYLGRWYASISDWVLSEKYLVLFFNNNLHCSIVGHSGPYLLLYSSYLNLGKVLDASTLLENKKWPSDRNKILAESMLKIGINKVCSLNEIWDHESLITLYPVLNGTQEIDLDSLSLMKSNLASCKSDILDLCRFFNKVTVIIPCYNAESSIETALRSLVQQDYLNYPK